MKKYSIIVVFMIIAICTYGFYFVISTSDSNKIKAFSENDKVTFEQEDYCKQFTNNKPIWDVNVTKQGIEVLLRGDSVNYFKNDIAKFIDALNRYNEVKIRLDSVKNGKAFTTILNDTYFTQSLGSAGANWYVASVVFTLTEAEGIKKVYINYEQGDYGVEPGFMNKDNIQKKYKICNAHK